MSGKVIKNHQEIVNILSNYMSKPFVWQSVVSDEDLSLLILHKVNYPLNFFIKDKTAFLQIGKKYTLAADLDSISLVKNDDFFELNCDCSDITITHHPTGEVSNYGKQAIQVALIL